MAATRTIKDPVTLVCQAPSCGFERIVEDADSTRLAAAHEKDCGDVVMTFLPSGA
jgi:hypothetical protein